MTPSFHNAKALGTSSLSDSSKSCAPDVTSSERCQGKPWMTSTSCPNIDKHRSLLASFENNNSVANFRFVTNFNFSPYFHVSDSTEVKLFMSIAIEIINCNILHKPANYISRVTIS